MECIIHKQRRTFWKYWFSNLIRWILQHTIFLIWNIYLYFNIREVGIDHYVIDLTGVTNPSGNFGSPGGTL